MANPVSIRPIRDDDDLDELHEGDDSWASAELARGMAASGGDSIIGFHVAEEAGRLVGYLDSFLAVDDNPTHAGYATVWVRPDARGRGIGTALWDFARPIAEARGARRLTARIDSKDDASLRWLAARGATIGGTHLESTLDLGDDLPLHPAPDGVTIATLPVDVDETVWQAAYDAHVRLMADTPDAETNPTNIPFAMYRTILGQPWQLCLATTEGGEIVGLTCVFPKSQKERSVNTMLTAVNREWRGKGLATALKTAHAVALRDAGWRSIVTQNMEGNDPILAANNRLGFRPSAALFDAIYDVPEG